MQRGGKRPGAGRKPTFHYPESKRCPTCNNGAGQVRPGTDFYRDRSKGGIRSLCKFCIRANRRDYYDKNGSSERDRYSSLRNRGFRTQLTFEEFCALRHQPCAYGGGAAPDVRIGLDRKDASKGYTVNNCVPCCARHNQIKSDFFSYTDMLLLVKTFPKTAKCGNTTAGRKKALRISTLPLRDPAADARAESLADLVLPEQAVGAHQRASRSRNLPDNRPRLTHRQLPDEVVRIHHYWTWLIHRRRGKGRLCARTSLRLHTVKIKP